MGGIPRRWSAAPVALALIAAGCGSHSRAPSTSVRTVSSDTPVHQVVMQTLAFIPGLVRARTGQQIVWRNQDNVPHNVTYVSGPAFRSSRRVLKPGARFSLTLTSPGTIHYFCSIHPWMRATIIVSP